MSQLPPPQNPVVHDSTEPAPLIQDVDYDSVSPVSDDSSKKSKATVLISSINKNEPIVTRRELWAYYCEFTLQDFGVYRLL